MDDRLKLIEGVYELQEWRRGGESFRPPAAAGRVVYASGTVTLVMRCDGGSWESHRYGLGRYAIDGDRLLYGYDRMFDYTRDERGSRATPEAATGGLRPYRMRMENGELACEGEIHGSGLRFTADRLEVLADGGAARIWKRLRT